MQDFSHDEKELINYANNQNNTIDPIIKLCKIKWFKKDKYGFLENEDIVKDIFIHSDIVQQCNIHIDLLPGDILECKINTSNKPSVVHISKLIRDNVNMLNLTHKTTNLKWFNIDEDYGFLNTGEFDIFLSGKLIRSHNIDVKNLFQGMKFECYFSLDSKQAYGIKLLSDSSYSEEIYA